jgi:hypothetical protein
VVILIIVEIAIVVLRFLKNKSQDPVDMQELQLENTGHKTVVFEVMFLNK